MKQRTLTKHRDPRQGINTTFPETLLTPHELRRVKNGRVVDGLIQKRNGTRKIHDTVLFVADGAKYVQGGFHYQKTLTAKQIVAVVNGDVKHKLETAADFTNLAGGFSTTEIARFQPYRSGANLYLYIACGVLKRFDGAALANPTNAPANAVDVALYKGRAAVIVKDSKRLYLSKTTDPHEFTVAAGAIEVDIETYDAEPLIALVACGASLILAKDHSLSRLTGASAATINVDRESEGLSQEVGCIARGTMIPVLDRYFFLSEQGPYMGSAQAIEYVGAQIRGQLEWYSLESLRTAVAVHDLARHVVRLTFARNGVISGFVTETWEYDYLLKKWDGPFERGNVGVITALWKYERLGGGYTIMSGGRGGWIQDEDVPNWYKDDTARLGADGTNVELKVVYPAAQHEDGTRVLSARNIVQHVEANLNSGGSLVHSWFSELGTGSTVIGSGDGPGLVDYPFKTDAKGVRIANVFTESSDQYAEIGVVSINASVGAQRQVKPSSFTPFGVLGLARQPDNFQHGDNSQITLAAGESRQLVVRPRDATDSAAPTSGLLWTSTNASRVSVSQAGVIQHVAAGSAVITATAVGGVAMAWVVTAS